MDPNKVQKDLYYNRLKTHKSGMKYLISRKLCDTNNISTIMLVIRVGAIHERNNEKGVSHFLEHLLFSGTCHQYDRIKNIYGPCKENYHDIFKEVDKLNGYLNAYTDKDHTAYHITLPNKFFKQGMNILFDMINNTKFRKSKIEKERNIVMEEFYMKNDEVEEELNNKLFGSVFEGHPLELTTIGGKKYIENYNLNLINRYFNKYYVSGNMFLVVVSNLSKNVISRNINNYMSNLKIHKTNDIVPIPKYTEIVSRNKPNLQIIEKDFDNCNINFGFLIPGHNNKDKFSIYILSQILGELYSCRLFTELREKNSLVYNIESGTLLYKEYGIFIINSQCDYKNSFTVIQKILEELEKLKNIKVTDEELNLSKNKLIYGIENKNQLGNYDLAELLTYKVLYYGKNIPTKEEDINNINKVTKRDILNSANNVFNYNTMSCICSGNINKTKVNNLFKEYIKKLN